MYNYTLTIKEKKKAKYNPHTRTIELSSNYDDLNLGNEAMQDYLNKITPKGYSVINIKKIKEKKSKKAD
jgi:hypothetical protein